MPDPAQGKPFVILVQVPEEAFEAISEAPDEGRSPVFFEGVEPPPPLPITPDADFSPFG